MLGLGGMVDWQLVEWTLIMRWLSQWVGRAANGMILLLTVENDAFQVEFLTSEELNIGVDRNVYFGDSLKLTNKARRANCHEEPFNEPAPVYFIFAQGSLLFW